MFLIPVGINYILDGTPLNPLISYMSSPTYRIEYDSVTVNGLDTILMLL